jgi:hypothetical protein
MDYYESAGFLFIVQKLGVEWGSICTLPTEHTRETISNLDWPRSISRAYEILVYSDIYIHTLMINYHAPRVESRCKGRAVQVIVPLFLFVDMANANIRHSSGWVWLFLSAWSRSIGLGFFPSSLVTSTSRCVIVPVQLMDGSCDQRSKKG